MLGDISALMKCVRAKVGGYFLFSCGAILVEGASLFHPTVRAGVCRVEKRSAFHHWQGVKSYKPYFYSLPILRSNSALSPPQSAE